MMAEGDDLDRLAMRAEHVRSLLRFASRPFVLEFAGSPKAGKTTSVDAIEHFFRRNKFRTHLMRERAPFCPIHMKGHLFFNMWCACTMLAEMLANVDTNSDLIVKDRGLFDTLIWIERQIKHGEVTNEEAERIQRFLLMDRWTRMVDLVLVVTVEPLVAIKRELKPRLSKMPGSIMNEPTLTSINEALLRAVNNYQSYFRKIKVYDTTNSIARRTNIEIGDDVLDHFEQFLDPAVLVLEIHVLKSHLAGGPGDLVSEGERKLLTLMERNGKFVKRSAAELRDDLVQVVACGILTHSDRIFLFKRQEKDPKSEVYGTNTILQSGHIAQGDAPMEALIKGTLFAKLQERLFLNRSFKARFLRYAWEEGNPNSRRHLGLLYELEIDSEDVANDLQKKEFKSGRGYGLYGQFLTPDELREKAAELHLDRWSADALEARVGG